MNFLVLFGFDKCAHLLIFWSFTYITIIFAVFLVYESCRII